MAWANSSLINNCCQRFNNIKNYVVNLFVFVIQYIFIYLFNHISFDDEIKNSEKEMREIMATNFYTC